MLSIMDFERSHPNFDNYMKNLDSIRLVFRKDKKIKGLRDDFDAKSFLERSHS